jgi:hypothetical protein
LLCHSLVLHIVIEQFLKAYLLKIFLSPLFAFTYPNTVVARPANNRSLNHFTGIIYKYAKGCWYARTH